MTPMYGGWLFYLINNTQHAGLIDNSNDFRKSCRTIFLNPFLSFLYWKMNYHIEHHMYPGVPFYNLPKLHNAIYQSLPTINVIGNPMTLVDISVGSANSGMVEIIGLHAIELDRDLIDWLKIKFKNEKKFSIQQGDILKVDLNTII